jgi:hypothetical protein
MLCYVVMVPLLPPVNCVGDSWGWGLQSHPMDSDKYIYILAAQHVRQLVFTHRLGQRQASVVLAARVVQS